MSNKLINWSLINYKLATIKYFKQQKMNNEGQFQ